MHWMITVTTHLRAVRTRRLAMISEDARLITKRIYQGYGTGSGILFGIEPEHRPAVEGVVQAVLDIVAGVIPASTEEEDDGR